MPSEEDGNKEDDEKRSIVIGDDVSDAGHDDQEDQKGVEHVSAPSADDQGVGIDFVVQFCPGHHGSCKSDSADEDGQEYLHPLHEGRLFLVEVHFVHFREPHDCRCDSHEAVQAGHQLRHFFHLDLFKLIVKGYL